MTHKSSYSMHSISLILLLASSLWLTACSSSSTGGDGNTGTNTAGSTTGTGTGTGTGNGVPGDADLSHAGTPILTQTADATDPLFSAVGRNRVAGLPNDLAVIYEVVENHGPDANEDCKALGAQYASCSVTNLHIKDAAGILSDGNWRLYFHSIRRILRVDSNEFTVAHVNGDLNYVEPTAGFSGFDDGAKTIKLITENSHLIETDFMPRLLAGA